MRREEVAEPTQGKTSRSTRMTNDTNDGNPNGDASREEYDVEDVAVACNGQSLAELSLGSNHPSHRHHQMDR